MKKITHLLFENAISITLTSIVSVIATVAIFYFTSSPISTSQMKNHFTQRMNEELLKIMPEASSFSLVIENTLSEVIDIRSTPTILLYGMARSSTQIARYDDFIKKINAVDEGEEDIEDYPSSGLYRVWAFFEQGKGTIVDKIIGRPGAWEITSFGYASLAYPEELTVSSIETVDVDGDGGKEFRLQLKSTYADSSSVGFFLFMKNQNDKWNLISIPETRKLTEDFLKGERPYPKSFERMARPFTHFGMAKEAQSKSKSKNKKKQKSPTGMELVGSGIYEDIHVAHHDGKVVEFATLRNGGWFSFHRHPVKGYMHIALLSFFVDENAVLDRHYVVVNVMKIDQGVLIRDVLWNWGYPIISIVPMFRSDIDLNSILEAGIQAHQINNTFFGFTEFERR